MTDWLQTADLVRPRVGLGAVMHAARTSTHKAATRHRNTKGRTKCKEAQNTLVKNAPKYEEPTKGEAA